MVSTLFSFCQRKKLSTNHCNLKTELSNFGHLLGLHLVGPFKFCWASGPHLPSELSHLWELFGVKNHFEPNQINKSLFLSSRSSVGFQSRTISTRKMFEFELITGTPCALRSPISCLMRLTSLLSSPFPRSSRKGKRK